METAVKFTYDSRKVIDLYIQAHGVCPSIYWISSWDMSAPSRKQNIWDALHAVILDEISG